MALAGAAHAQAQVDPQDNYPTALNRQVLGAWLREATDLQPEQVVAVSPSAATAIVARTPVTDGRTQARLRAVAITPQAVARGGVLAWEMQLDIDCKARQVRAGATTGYATRRSTGDGLALSSGDAAWRRPKAGTILEAAWRAVCDAKFQSPLSGGPLQVAEAKPAAPAPRTAPPSPARPSPAAKPPVALAPVALAPVAQASVAPAPAPVAPRLTPARLTLPDPAQARQKPKPEPQAAPPPKKAAAPPARPVPVRTVPKAGPNAVQVVSSPIEADTRKKLDRLQRRFGSALQQGVEIRVVQAQVGGQKVYRGVVAGFATRREAHVFCQTLKQSGQDCVSW